MIAFIDNNLPRIKSSALSLTLTLFLAFGHVSAAPTATSAAAPVSEKVHRVVFQVTLDGEENWNKVLNQIENLKKGFAPDKVEIEVVTHGDAGGLVLAKNTALSERIQKIEATGVQFSLCANTQKKNNIKPEEITPGVTIVPAGIVQVIKRQEEGWSYVKAGN
jgi:intracellular sulfur oxidation DsrE/DsrF family protein